MPLIIQAEQTDPVLGRVLLDLAHHARDLGIPDPVAGPTRRHVMIRHSERETRLRNRRATLRQPAEGVKGTFMHVMAINPEQRLAVIATHNFVRHPKFIDRGLGIGHVERLCRMESEPNLI